MTQPPLEVRLTFNDGSAATTFVSRLHGPESLEAVTRILRKRFDGYGSIAGVSLVDDQPVEAYEIALVREQATEQPTKSVIRAERDEGFVSLRPRERRIKRCRSVLELVHHFLPAVIREDALDEWIDELEAAAAEGAPIVKRTVSIVTMAVPRLVIRGVLSNGIRARRRANRD